MSRRPAVLPRVRVLPVTRTAVVPTIVALAALLASPHLAGAATVDWRPSPIAFVGVTGGAACPTAAQAAGEDGLALAELLASSRGKQAAAEVFLSTWLSRPAPIVSVCDPAAAAAGQALGAIGGRVAIAPWSDGVGAGLRVRAGSHLTAVGAVRAGDRYALPAGLSPDAVVDVAVRTPAGATTVRAAVPAGTAPTTVTVEGPASAPTVVVTGTDGRIARTPAEAPAALRAAVSPRAAGVSSRRMQLRVTASAGAIVVAIPTTKGYQGQRERKAYAGAVVARGTGSPVPLTISGIDTTDVGVDVVILGLRHRQLAGARCTLRGAPIERATVRCAADAVAPMAVWSGRHPSWVKGELRGRHDELVGASIPDLSSAGSVVERAIDDVSRIPGYGDAARPRPDQPVRDAAPLAPAGPRSTTLVPASATTVAFDRIANVPEYARDDLDDEAVYGALQAGDVNGDLAPDLLLGSEVPLLLMSIPSGLRNVEFDTGGDGGTFGPDVDGDGTTELVDAMGTIVLGRRTWAEQPPALVGGTDWKTGGPGELSWSHDDLGSEAGPVPVPDRDGDGRPELLDVGGRGIDAVYAGRSIPAGSRTRLPRLLAPAGGDPLRAFQDELPELDRFSLSSTREAPDEVATVGRSGAAVRLTVQDGFAGPPSAADGSLLRWQTVDLAQPGGLGPPSAPLRIYSRPTLLDADGPSGDLLVRAATRSCLLESDPCDQTLRVTRAGAIRASFGRASSSCAFLDDGPDADGESEVVCTARTGRLPSRWSDYDRSGEQGLAVASSALSGPQSLARLPRIAVGGTALRSAGGFSTVRTSDGRRHLATVGIQGAGRKATATLVVAHLTG